LTIPHDALGISSLPSDIQGLEALVKDIVRAELACKKTF
jgi:hypothetical protein